MRTIFGLILFFLFTSCNGQSEATPERQVGGPCEDCEAALDYKML